MKQRSTSKAVHQQCGEDLHSDEPIPAKTIAAENVPAELIEEHRWVAWDATPRADGRPSKTPLDPRTGQNAKSNDSRTWGTFAEACAAAERMPHAGGVGIMLTNGPWLALDLDHVIKKSTGELGPGARALIDALTPTYVERSPGGDGLHVWFRGLKPAGWRSNAKNAFGPGTALEGYDGSAGRYLTITGEAWTDEPLPIAAAAEGDLEVLGTFLVQPTLKPRQADTPVQRAAPRHLAPIDGDDIARARWLLLDAGVLDGVVDDYDMWFRALAALRALGDAGLALAVEWSRRGQKFVEGGVERRWPGITGSSVGALFGMADDADPTWRDRYRDTQPERLEPPTFVTAGDSTTAKVSDPPAAKPDAPYPTMSWLDVAALPPVEWLVEGLIPEHSIGFLFGRPTAGKSFVALDLLARMASGGRSWLGVGIEPGPVLMFVGEGHAGIAGRLRAWRGQHDEPHVYPFDLVNGVPPLAAESAPTYLALMNDFVARHGVHPQLCVIDTWGQGLPGGENDDAVVLPALHLMGNLRRRFGTSVWAIAHPRKEQQGEEDRPLTAADLRGHSSLLGNVDGVIGIDTSGQQRRILPFKTKDGGARDPICFNLLPVVTGECRRDGTPETSCIVVPVDAVAAPTPAEAVEGQRLRLVDKLAEMEQRAVDALRRLGWAPNGSTVVAEMVGNRSDKFAAFNRAVARGTIINEGTAKAPRYVVPAQGEGGEERTKEGSREPGTEVPGPVPCGSGEPAGTDGNRGTIDDGQSEKPKGRRRKARRSS